MDFIQIGKRLLGSGYSEREYYEAGIVGWAAVNGLRAGKAASKAKIQPLLSAIKNIGTALEEAI